jgi:hypothetical protein
VNEKVEKSSPDWSAIRRRYEGEACSIRALAREHETTDTRIHRRAKSERWIPFGAKSAANPTPQRGPQRRAEKIENAKTWAFEPRRDALVSGLCRVRNAAETPEGAIYSDLPVLMALMWLRTPLGDIAQALQMDEVELEEIWGGAIEAFAEEYLQRAAASRADENDWRCSELRIRRSAQAKSRGR